jgi:hypothetical protein
MTIDDHDPDHSGCRNCRRAAWLTAFLAVLASWRTTFRAGLLVVLVLGMVGFWSLYVAVGPVEMGSR